MSLREAWYCPSSSSRGLAQILPGYRIWVERQDIKLVGPNLLSKGTDFIRNTRWKNSTLEALSRVKDIVKSNWKVTKQQACWSAGKKWGIRQHPSRVEKNIKHRLRNVKGATIWLNWFLYSSLSNSFKWWVMMLTGDFSSFLRKAGISMNFPPSTAFATYHRFWGVVS